MDDEPLIINRAATGDPEAFARLFESYYAMIHAFVYRLCLNESEAGDLAQETFIKAARALPAYRGGSSFKSWLFRIATNAVRDWHRSRARRARLEDAIATEQATDGQIRQREVAPVREALLSLSAELREAITLVYFEEMNHSEAAKVLGCAETTVSWRIFRAKRQLKKLLEARSE